MQNFDQFLENLTKTSGWAGSLSVNWDYARISATSSMPLTFTVDGNVQTTIASDGRNVTYAIERPTLAEAVRDFEPILDALFTAKAAEYGDEATYPAAFGLEEVAA